MTSALKAKLLSIALGTTLVVPSNITTKGLVTPTETYYPLLMQAVEIKTETNIVTCMDRHGNLWEFESDDAFVGDLYTCIMTDNGTDEEEDDEIVTIRFAGEVCEYPASEIITGYNETETGILLHYENGTGYYIEK